MISNLGTDILVMGGGKMRDKIIGVACIIPFMIILGMVNPAVLIFGSACLLAWYGILKILGLT